VSRAEAKLEVESALTQLDRFDGHIFKSPVDFDSCVYRCRMTKLMAVILIGESYTTTFEQAPQASRYESHLHIDHKHPIVITPRELLEAMPDEPLKFTHGTYMARPSRRR